MSFLVKPVQFDFLNKNNNKNIFKTDDDSFNFKYVSRSQLNSIIKDVARKRNRRKEDSAWASLVGDGDFITRDYKDYEVPGISNVKRLMRDNMEEVDQELKRLKEDALPERSKRLSKSASTDRTKSTKNEKKNLQANETKQSIRADDVDELLAITEETKYPLSQERSPISRLEYSARTRKSHSECTLVTSSIDEKLRCVENWKYNYEGEQRESEIVDRIYEPRPHPLVANKILSMQKKISVLLDEIAHRLTRIPLPDGDRDLLRRKQCVMEFAIRFSRNYLYELGRQISDIRRHAKAIENCEKLRSSQRYLSMHIQAMEQKLISSHQLLIHALDAYSKHIPSSVVRAGPGKLREILQVVTDLGDICMNIHVTSDYYGGGDVEFPSLGKDMKNRCEDILTKMGLRNSDNESPQVNRTSQSTPIEGFRNKTANKNNKLKGPSSRLSMYNASIRLPGKNLGNRKPATRHMSDTKPLKIVRRAPSKFYPTTPEKPNTSPASYKTSREPTKRSRPKIRLPKKEDEIGTMMSILPMDSDVDSGSTLFENSQTSLSIHKGSVTRRFSSKNQSSSNNSESSLTPRNREADTCVQVLAKGSNEIEEKELSSMVPVIADLMTLIKNQREDDIAISPVSAESIEGLLELLQKYRSSKNSVNPHVESSIATASSSTIDCAKIRGPAKKSMETRSGVKNMQLICLPSEENSQLEKNHVKNIDSERIKETEINGISSTALRNKKNRILRINDSSLEALIKYRDDYQNWSHTNPMYTSRSQNKPWDVVGWISDKLVDELIVDVSKEFEIYEVIQKLFELEFKEF